MDVTNLSDEEKVKYLVERREKLLDLILDKTPPILIGCWAFFHQQIIDKNFYDGKTLDISDLLCNREWGEQRHHKKTVENISSITYPTCHFRYSQH